MGMAPLFTWSGKECIRLNIRQRAVRDSIRAKLESGQYSLENRYCLCKAPQYDLLSDTDRYGLKLNFVICKNCGMVRMNPSLNQESLRKFYQYDYRLLFMESDCLNAKYFFQKMERGRYIHALIKRYCPFFTFDSSSVLDIGCATGAALVPFYRSGAQVKGLDYDQRYIEFGMNYDSNLNLQYGGIEDLEKEAVKYDLIICDNVLEHMADPFSAVLSIKAALRTNGIAFISVPHLKNYSHYASYGRSFIGALHISHLFCFTKSSLLSISYPLETVFINNRIDAIFKNAQNMPTRGTCNEYDSNIRFIKTYENNLFWKVTRKVNALLGIVSSRRN